MHRHMQLRGLLSLNFDVMDKAKWLNDILEHEGIKFVRQL